MKKLVKWSSVYVCDRIETGKKHLVIYNNENTKIMDLVTQEVDSKFYYYKFTELNSLYHDELFDTANINTIKFKYFTAPKILKWAAKRETLEKTHKDQIEKTKDF